MKYVIALCLVVVVGLPVAVFSRNYTIVETMTGGEWLVLKAEQSKECAEGGGCAVFSNREFDKAMSEFAQWLMQRMGPKL